MVKSNRLKDLSLCYSYYIHSTSTKNLRKKLLLNTKGVGMLNNLLQVHMASVAYVPLLILSFLLFLIVVAVLWKRGKTIEALLAWNSLWLYVIALILLFRL